MTIVREKDKERERMGEIKLWMREIKSKSYLKIESPTKACLVMSTENAAKKNLIVVVIQINSHILGALWIKGY